MILNIAKPLKSTSFDVVAQVRSISRTKKVGHAGTLDPLAEGVLIILTEKDTKRQNEFMKMDKEYYAEIDFSLCSPTYDLEGPISSNSKMPAKEEILARIPLFIGNIEQKVPAYSAVKVHGTPLYKSARKGTLSLEDIPVKKVTIYSIEVLDFPYPLLKCRIVCGSGTYIRSLAHDLGGILSKLVRTRVGPYKLEEARTLESLVQP